MAKTQRLFELMMTINAKQKFTARELAQEFGVSYRTILRDLDELSALGVPLYSEVGANGGYYLLHDRMLPPIFFKESEAVAMFLAYHSLQFFGALPFQAETDMALKKFYQHLPEDIQKRIDRMKERVVFWNPSRVQSSDYLNVILETAIEQGATLIHYDGSEGISERTIQPIGLYSYNGFWYCPAYCLKRESFRLFRADRIQFAKRVSSEKKRDLPYRSIRDWIKWSERDVINPVLFKVDLTLEGVRRAKSDLDLRRMIRIRDDGTGWINTQIPKTEITYFADLLWGFGTDATIKEPSEAILHIRRKISAMARLYR
ncbi:helix-turn-helix transcriptional regulator [Desmospora activa]|uniref:Putative DNA-binding transcriptional regulator YafY n=1 Tax=Desmospora activa DSM 45169 TaxID=1121389 RepID=A0A2T4Z8R1_9BACL|nr:YafY family protein [Desmospora activa]PTM58267.1 putative DNA-binding transcriptional regulator YafY [Desmospora activa DSM 45169]